MKWWLGCCLVVVFALGCGTKQEGESDKDGGNDSKSSSKTSAPNPDAKPWDPALATATVQGAVKFEGKPPKRRAIDMAGRAECAKHAKPVLDETVIVGEDKSLENVVVWVKSGLRAWKFTPPKTAAVLDQKGCHFEPHVLAMQVGQPLEVKNSDEFAHNVHSLSAVNPGFNFTQQGNKVDTKTFATREFFRMKCDIHGWMSTWVAVIEHPFFAVTGKEGKFVIKGLPKGEFEVEAWHEDLGKKSAKVKLDDKESKTVDFSFSR